MKTIYPIETLPVIERIQRLLYKIDRLRLPKRSRRDVVSILVRQVSKELDRHLLWQAGHGRRTASVAISLGESLGLSFEALHHLKLASYLHDIGLLMVPQAERGDDTPDTYEAIQNHPRVGSNILEPFSFLREASILIAHHHERWDGTGYPYGIRGTFIPIGARILSIADAFDAIRVPKIADHTMRNWVAFRILRVSAGTQFDPTIVEALREVLQRGKERTVSTR
ncbi:HD-GYP domain-containing protein [Petrachloros mirabilis]